MGITETRSPWNRSRTGFSDQNRFGHSPQSSPRNDGGGHLGKDCATRRDMPVEQPGDGNRVVEPVVRDRR
jgi:hypothetical protein